MCNENASANDAALIRGALASFFWPDRVKYFAVSSLGFYLQPDGTFNPRDPGNAWRGSLHVRGEVRPAGVLEPLLQLANRIQRSGWEQRSSWERRHRRALQPPGD